MSSVIAILAAVEPALADPCAQSATESFAKVLAPYGLSYLQTRVYRRPLEPLTSVNHWEAGGIIGRFGPSSWPGSSAFDYVCFECNPLLPAVRKGHTSWRFEDYAPRSDPRFRDYWDALGEAGISEAFGAIAQGDCGWLSNVHLGMSDPEATRNYAQGMSFASVLLAEHLLALNHRPIAEETSLTDRERDCIAFVAAGKTDWDIGVILDIAESTAKFHINNVKKKLNASTRAQAVAKCALRGSL